MECEVCGNDTMELTNKVNDQIGCVEKNYKCSYCHSELTWSYGHWELQEGINFQKEKE